MRPPEDMVCLAVNVFVVLSFAYPVMFNVPLIVVVEEADPIEIVPSEV